MTTRTAPPHSDHHRSIVTRSWAVGLALSLTVAVGSSLPAHASDDESNTAQAGNDDVPALTPAEFIEVLTDDALSFDNGLVRASDPAPSETLLAELLAGSDDAAPDVGDRNGVDGVDDGVEQQTAQSGASFADAFSLHTRPNTGRKIYLDFNGHVTVNTPWNSRQSTITSGIYSRESKSSRDAEFSQYELDGIVDIWERVAEDFAPWDVDVTTEEPPTGGLTRDSTADQTYGIRVVVSQDSAWYGPYGGAAYLSSFDKAYDLPAFVFASNLANGNPKSVAEAISHEAGHSFGLHHDGVTDESFQTPTCRSGNPDSPNTGYYCGHGDWAPIMGVGYGKPITQWSKGEYAGANNNENDVALIDRSLVRVRRPATRGTLAGSDSVTTDVITDGGEVARYRLRVTEGPVVVNVERRDPSGNLFADLTIRNASGAVVAAAVPGDPSASTLGATLPRTTPPGTYTIEVRSIGWKSPETGFSSYASVGEFVLDVDVPDSGGGTTPPPTTPTTTAPTTTTPKVPTTPPTTAPPPPPVPPPSGKPTAEYGDRLTAISPVRLLDTRQPGGPARLHADGTIRISMTGIPRTSTAVVVNVVAVHPSVTGYISVTPCNQVDPAQRTSSLNYVPGRNIGNSVISPLSADGELCIYSSAGTDVLMDITGWIGPDGTDTLDAISAERVVDTRTGLGVTGRLVSGRREVVSLAGLVGDTRTNAVAINITAVNPSASGFITVDDCSATSTATSSLNFTVGRTRGNNGIFSLSSDRSLCITSSVGTHVTIDVTGRFGSARGLTFVPATPERLLDTRRGSRLPAGASTGFDIPTPATENGFSLRPVAASVNIAAALHTNSGYVTSWNCGPRPETSALNPVAGIPTANSALVPITTEGHSCLFHANGGHLIVDLNGWWV